MMTRMLTAAILLSSSTILGGCLALAAGAATGVGTYAYIKGELHDTEEVSLDRAWSATQAAMKELEFNVKNQAKDALQARLTAEQADKTEITIKLDSEGEKITKFSIRVGVFGDESTSRLIMDKIKQSL